jgi:hypothetical protein
LSRAGLQHAPQAPEKSAAATSLRIGPAHDSFEQEAEQAAEKVTTGEHRHVAWSLSRVGLGPIQRQCSCGGSCDDCKKKKEVLQRNATSSAAVGSHAPASVASTLSSPGSSLDPGTRKFMESRFGHDFSSVRIHTDHDAAASAGEVNAAAYTVGNQIVFGSGFFAPSSTPGRILLAHELAHVVQQGAGRSLHSSVNPSSEHEATLAGYAVGRNADRVPIRETSGIGIAALSIAEARRALWSHVPDGVKEYVRPAAREAAAQMDKIIPPNTEIPKPIENVVLHPVDTAVQAVEHPVEAVKAVAATVEAAAPAIKKVAAEIPKIVKAKVKKEVHDVVLTNVGRAKGVVLEAAQIVDTVAWVPYAVHEMEQKALGNSATAKVLIDATDHITQYATLNALAEQGLSANPREPGKPAGPFGISNAVSGGIDKYVGDPLEKQLGDGKPAQGLLFTSYEQGELEGAVGTQVALAYVGVEEVQLGLKVLGAIGGVKGLYDSYERNPEGWKTDPNFWAAFIGLALGILGLRASRSAGKITKILLAGGALVPIVPLVYNLFQHYRKMPDGPEKDKALKADAGAIVKAVAAAIHALIQHGGGGKGAGAEQEPEGGSQSSKKAPAQEETPPTKSSTAPVDEKQAPVAKPQPITDQAPEQHPAPAADQKAPAVHDSEAPAAAKPPAPPAAEQVPSVPPDKAIAPAVKEQPSAARDAAPDQPKKVISLDEYRQKRAASQAQGAKPAAKPTAEPENLPPAKPVAEENAPKKVTSLDEYRAKKKGANAPQAEPESQAVPAEQEHVVEAEYKQAAGAEGTVPQNEGQTTGVRDGDPTVASIGKGSKGGSSISAKPKSSSTKSASPGASRSGRSSGPKFTPDEQRKADVIDLFGEAQGRGRAAGDVQSDLREELGDRRRPGGKSVPKAAERGNFAHEYYEKFEKELLPNAENLVSEKLPAGLEKEHEIEIPDLPKKSRPRIDRLDKENGIVYEIKPDTLRSVGQAEAEAYASQMDKYEPLPPPKKWQAKCITYDADKVTEFLHKIGFFEGSATSATPTGPAAVPAPAGPPPGSPGSAP